MYLSLGVIVAAIALYLWRTGRMSFAAMAVSFTAGVLLAGTLLGQLARSGAQTGANVVQTGTSTVVGGGGGQPAHSTVRPGR